MRRTLLQLLSRLAGLGYFRWKARLVGKGSMRLILVACWQKRILSGLWIIWSRWWRAILRYRTGRIPRRTQRVRWARMPEVGVRLRLGSFQWWTWRSQYFLTFFHRLCCLWILNYNLPKMLHIPEQCYKNLHRDWVCLQECLLGSYEWSQRYGFHSRSHRWLGSRELMTF